MYIYIYIRTSIRIKYDMDRCHEVFMWCDHRQIKIIKKRFYIDIYNTGTCQYKNAHLCVGLYGYMLFMRTERKRKKSSTHNFSFEVAKISILYVFWLFLFYSYSFSSSSSQVRVLRVKGYLFTSISNWPIPFWKYSFKVLISSSVR